MDRLHMGEWILMALVMYVVCIVLRTYEIEPQVQVVLWKLANVTVAAFVGYWIDRRAFGRILTSATPLEQIRRAIVMAAAMLAVALGL